jgi:PAS domain S-box-containing protein
MSFSQLLRAVIGPPEFSDPELSLKAAMLYRVLLVFGAIMVALIAAAPMVLPSDPLIWTVELFLLGSMVASIVLLRHRRIRTVSIWFTTATWLAVTAGAWFLGGFLSPAIWAYPVVVLIAGLFWNRSAAVACTVLSLVAGLGIAWATDAGFIATAAPRPIEYWYGFVGVLGGATAVIYYGLGVLSRGLDAGRQLRLALDAASLGTWRWDVSSGSVSWSDNIEAVFGQCRGSFTGRYADYLELVHEDDLTVIKASLEQTLETGEPYRFEHRVRTSDDSIRWVLGMGEATNDISGRPSGLVGTFADVTERKESEIELRRQVERNRSMLDSMMDGFVFAEFGGKIIDVNPAFARLTQYSIDELRGMTIHQLDQKFSPEEIAKLAPRIAEEGGRLIETRVRRKDGVVFDADLSLVGMETDEGPAMAGFMRDTTERVRAERALSESEERYRTLFETMAQGVVYQSTDGQITNANPAAERILGLSLDQMQGRTSVDPRWRAIHEDGSPFPGETHPAMVALRTGKPVEDTVMGVFHPEEGQHRWINVNAVPQFGPGSDVPYQVYTSFDDITERRAARQQLEEQVRRNEQILTTTMDGYILADTDGRLLDVNPSYSAMSGYRREELLGMNIRQLEVEMGPEEIERRIEAMVRQGADRFETRHRCKDGREIDLDVSVAIMHGDHSPLVAAFVRDVSNRRRVQKALEESEARFRRLAENAPAIVYRFRLGDDPGFDYISPAVTAVTGYKPEEFYADPELCFRTVHPEDRPDLEALYQGKLPRRPHEVRWVHKDGSIVWTEDRHVPLFDDEGNLSAIEGLALDITDSKMTHEALRQSQEQLASVVRSAPVILWALDEDGIFTLSEGRGLSVLGLEPGAVVGASVFDVYADNPTIVENNRRALRGEESQWVAEVAGTFFDTRVTPVRGENGEVNGLIGVATDITELKLTEQELRLSREQLRLFAARLQDVREEERTSMAREIHDELGQTLTVLKMDLCWLLDRYPIGPRPVCTAPARGAR